MSKELKAIEDLFYIANKFNDTCPIDKLKQKHRVDLDNDYRIIEKALKEREELKKCLKSEIEHSAFLNRERLKDSKKLKALEIIKRFVDFNVYEMQGKHYLTTGNNYRGQILISKEEYELLKEVFDNV